MVLKNSSKKNALVDSPQNNRPVQGELFAFSSDGEESVGYRGSVAMKIAGITYRQLDYWARKNIIEPSINPSHGSGSRRLYSFKDISIMAVAKCLLDAGVNLTNVTTAIVFLNCYSISHLENMTIICNGQSVMECNNNQEDMFNMLEGGSAVFAIAVGCIVKQVRADLTKESSI
ncbi:MerR family transcriptional regulator [Gardnerella vaginalis]|uniref:MerR family transcriptional regulator n=1 Tax=Gardnerella vaginalis TaxID=2702 RepID=UPI0039F118E5